MCVGGGGECVEWMGEDSVCVGGGECVEWMGEDSVCVGEYVYIYFNIQHSCSVVCPAFSSGGYFHSSILNPQFHT